MTDELLGGEVALLCIRWSAMKLLRNTGILHGQREQFLGVARLFHLQSLTKGIGGFDTLQGLGSLSLALDDLPVFHCICQSCYACR